MRSVVKYSSVQPSPLLGKFLPLITEYIYRLGTYTDIYAHAVAMSQPVVYFMVGIGQRLPYTRRQMLVSKGNVEGRGSGDLLSRSPVHTGERDGVVYERRRSTE
ncbi:hypothetical protein [Oryza sativa Japonica Group]|uniref:Uncharacterized protein n=1 Tax=Oryza sativa subsp. japonica TaxID=39947 RepID=Q5QM98_ORYSJ|nr:hypothetical protein [Oryza sativa Japonica Group]